MVDSKGSLLLIVEDDEIQQTVIGMTLEHLGQDFDLLEIPDEVFKRIQQKKYRLVLIDLTLRGDPTAGLALGQKVREYWGEARPPWIIATTAYLSDSLKEACKTAHFDAFLEKPLLQNRWEKLIDQYLVDPVNTL